MSRSRHSAAPGAAPLAMLVARAAANSHDVRLGGADLHTAITKLASLTRIAVLERGIVASDELRAAVDDIATRHLKRAAADRRLSRVLGKIGDRELRNAIEVAHDQVLDPSEVAHYYAGLMAGLALLEAGRSNR